MKIIINDKEDILDKYGEKSWQEFVNNKLDMMYLNELDKKLYRAIIISDELLEELSGNPVKVKLGEDWEGYRRCPICGEYLFTKQMHVNAIVSYDDDGMEYDVKNITPLTNRRRCRCGVYIYID